MRPVPFEILTLIVFICAIIHTFLTPRLFLLSKKMAVKAEKGKKNWRIYHFCSELIYFASEVEVVFGLWVFPLIVAYPFFFSTKEVVNYINSHDYSAPFYFTVIMVIVGTRPILYFAEGLLEKLAKLGKDTPAAWWWTIMMAGPLLSIILKEPGAMTLSAIVLAHKFYHYKPSLKFQYATLALLFSNISLSALLNPYASKSLFLISSELRWEFQYLFFQFGWKALIAILLNNTTYFFFFRKEFQKSNFPKKIPLRKKSRHAPPLWITIIHLIFVFLIAYNASYFPIFIAFFVIFLGFYRATSFYQDPLKLQPAILVGFFFASLMLHGELQAWWVSAIWNNLSPWMTLVSSTIFSTFIDDATLLYIFSKLPRPLFENSINYVIAGALSSGGLTIIANGPNLIGYSFLREFFGEKISFFPLFLAALLPTVINLLAFWFL